MAEPAADGSDPAGRRSVAGWPLGLVGHLLGRFGRHWFILGVLFGGVCLAIRGSILLDYGVAFLFREDRPLDGLALASLLHSQAFFTELMAMLLAGAVWVFAVDLDPQSTRSIDRWPFHVQLWHLGPPIVLLGAIPLLALIFPYSQAVQPLATGELQRAIAGSAAGLLLTFMVLSVAWLIEEALIRLAIGHLGIRRFLRNYFPHLHRSVQWDNIAWRVVILWAMYVVAWVAIIVGGLRLPAVAIFALVGLLLAVYVLLNFFVERARLWVFLALLALPILVHRNTVYSYSFPGFEDHYALCDVLVAQPDKVASASERAPIVCAKASAGSAVAGPADFRQPVSRAVALNALKTLHLPPRTGGGEQLPRLVVVTISGGAYRAAFWGALVLDRLREESAPGRKLEGLAQSIRLLTGASGGMVPAAYFAMLPPAALAHPRSGAGKASQSIEHLIGADIATATGGSAHDVSYDSLSPVASQLVRDDLFNVLLPWRRDADRGRALEEQWRTLDVTFEELRSDEAAGRRPSLIFSPMIAETGQPLLISNLDLTGITDPDVRQTFDLFKEIPDAARRLKLRTAVRMSATFPFVSPSVSLPTVPPLHVLDAGYFDDYGMSTALGYLKQPDVIDWLSKNTSGVILIQINAFPVRTLESEIRDPVCRDRIPGPLDRWIGRVLSPLTGPLGGLFSARGASMIFRNDQEFDELKQLMSRVTTKDGTPLHFERVSFENAARASFSWYLPEGDLNCMRLQLAEPHNAEAYDRLVTIWNGWTPSVSTPEGLLAPPGRDAKLVQ